MRILFEFIALSDTNVGELLGQSWILINICFVKVANAHFAAHT